MEKKKKYVRAHGHGQHVKYTFGMYIYANFVAQPKIFYAL